MSAKDKDNTFDLSLKWDRTLPFFGNFSWDIYIPQIKISKLIFDILLWAKVQNPTQAFKSDKGLANTFDFNPKWERTLPSFGNFS
jgi:hypothetical protein